MTSLKESSDVTDGNLISAEKEKDLTELPPSGTSLHRRRRGEPPASLSVKPQTPSDEGSSPCTAGPNSEYYWSLHDGEIDAETLCESMLQRLKEHDDLASKRGKELALRTKDTVDSVEQLEKLIQILNQFVTLKENNARLLKKLRDVNHLRRLHETHKKIDQENERLRIERKELLMINEALEAEIDSEYGQMMFDCIMAGGRIKRSGSKWKGHSRFGGSLLRRQRARSAGGDDSDVSPGTPLRRRSEGIFSKEVEKSKVSKWTKVKAAFR